MRGDKARDKTVYGIIIKHYQFILVSVKPIINIMLLSFIFSILFK